MVSVVECNARKRRFLTFAPGLNCLIVVLAGFLVIAMLQAVQIGMLRSRANEVYSDVMILQSRQNELYDKYATSFYL